MIMGIFGALKKKAAKPAEEAEPKMAETPAPHIAKMAEPTAPHVAVRVQPEAAVASEEKPAEAVRPEEEGTIEIHRRLSEGPLFVSLDKFREVKAELITLKKSAADVRVALENLKANRSAGQQILEESYSRLADIEGRLELVTKTLRID